MMRTWLWLGTAVLVSAGLYLATVAGSVAAFLLTYLTPLPLFLLGLSLGGRLSGLAGAVAAMLVAGAAGPQAALLYLGFCGIPVAVLCELAERRYPGSGGPGTGWYPPGLLCVWLALMPLGLFLLVTVYVSATGGSLEQLIADEIRALMAQYREILGQAGDGTPVADSEQFAFLESLFARIAPGLLASLWMTLTAINGVMAQSLLVRRGSAIRPAPAMGDIELPRRYVVGFAVALLIGMTLDGPLGFIGVNAAVILAFPLLLSGLGVAHVLAARTGLRVVLLFFLYLVLAVTRWGAVVMIAIGLIDHFAGLKKRLRGQSPSV